jgi:hypothetical protein
MSVEEKLREIIFSEELPDSEKLDRLHALIQPEAFKIDNLNQATPAISIVRLIPLSGSMQETLGVRSISATALFNDSCPFRTLFTCWKDAVEASMGPSHPSFEAAMIGESPFAFICWRRLAILP